MEPRIRKVLFAVLLVDGEAVSSASPLWDGFGVGLGFLVESRATGSPDLGQRRWLGRGETP
jgi:hypothetical protein